MCPTVVQHNPHLWSVVLAALEQNGGWMPFSQYMDLVLYHERGGYYTRSTSPFGGMQGDYVTAPELSSPLFGHALARYIISACAAGCAPVLCEYGPGSGKLCVDLLSYADAHDCKIERYLLIEIAAERRRQQQQYIAQALPQGSDRVEWHDEMPTHFSGIVVANELLDALPTDIVVWYEQSQSVRGVACCNDHLVWADRALAQFSAPLQAAAAVLPPIQGPWPYCSEISLAQRHMVYTIASRLSQGVALWIDYGFAQAEYYHPQRSMGTLMCHHQQRVHINPLVLLGEQDVTAHVDFTACAAAARAAQAEVYGYTTQEQFLLNLDILLDDQLDTLANDRQRAQALSAARILLHPAEMGSLFKVLCITKNIDHSCMRGFETGNRVARL